MGNFKHNTNQQELHGTPSPASMVTNILNCTIETNKITHLD
jgi:hypothetical protein